MTRHLITWTIRFFLGQHFSYLIFNSNWGFMSSKHWMILLANGWQISQTKASRNLHSFHPPWWACWNGFWEQCEELHGPAKFTQLNYFSNWDKSRSYYKLNLSSPEKTSKTLCGLQDKYIVSCKWFEPRSHIIK